MKEYATILCDDLRLQNIYHFVSGVCIMVVWIKAVVQEEVYEYKSSEI